MECGQPPPGHPVRIGAVFQNKAEAVHIVPIALSQECGAEAPFVQLAAFEQDLQDRIVVGLNDVVCSLLIVRIGAAFE